MPSLDLSVPHPDDPTTPAKSFFLHSPPESPVNTPSSNPFSQITGSISSLASKARPATSDTSHARSSSMTSRPSTSDGNGNPTRNSSTKRTKHKEDKIWQLEADPFASRGSVYSAHFSTHSQPNVSSTLPKSESKKRHGSMLFTSSDGLFSRSRSKLNRTTAPVITETLHEDVVLDISVEQQRRLEREQEEVLERERLREAAARSIGLQSEVVPSDLPSEEQYSEAQESLPRVKDQELSQETDAEHQSEATQLKSQIQIPLPRISIEPLANGTTRPSSSFSNSHVTSSPSTPIFKLPDFPATHANLSHAFVQSGIFPRYIAPSSAFSHLLGISRVWKTRLVCLSTLHHSPKSNNSFLHIFKNPTIAPDNVEVDRLEINEDSVVFVSDDEVGGRKHVLRIGGQEVGSSTSKKSSSLPLPKGLGQGMSIWFLHIESQAEMQQWISAIKTIVLERRADAAGLALPNPSQDSPYISPQGPGDLDVALRLRAQDLYLPSTLPPISPISPLNPQFPSHLSDAKSPSETQSEASVRAPSRNSTISKLRGFFSSSALPVLSTVNKSRSQSPSGRDDTPPRDHEIYRGSTLKAMFRQSAAVAARPNHSRASSSKLETHYEDDAAEMKLTFAAPPSPGRSLEHLPASTVIAMEDESESKIRRDSSPSTNEQIQGGLCDAGSDPLPSITSDQVSPQSLPNPESETREHQETVLLSTSSVPFSTRRDSKETDRSSSSRIRYSIALPEKLAPPLGPLPQPPSAVGDISTPVNGSARTSAHRFSKRISNTSTISTFSSHSSNASRLSTLFAGRLPPQTGVRSSIPPPARPMPTFAPPPIPRPESTDAAQTNFSQSDRRRPNGTSSATKRSSQVSLEKLPPIASPPSYPLPPIPATESETELPAKIGERTRLMSAPSPRTPSATKIATVDHPFGRPTTSDNAASTFMEPFTPETTPKGEMATSRAPQHSEELVPIPLSPPPRRNRSSKQVIISKDDPKIIARRGTNAMSIRSSTVIL